MWFAVTKFHYYWFQLSFSITSKCCFTLPKHTSWGNTKMLLCTYCVGQLPQIWNGNGFLPHCRDLGMIIILASSTAGNIRDSSSFRSLPLFFVCMFVSASGNLGFLLSKCLLSLLIFHSSALLSSCSVFFCQCPCSSLLCFSLPLAVWTKTV